MSQDIREFVRLHHAFYEVSPYSIVIEERHGTPSAATRTVQAGFDVDIYGAAPNNEMNPPGGDPEYSSGCDALLEIAQRVSRQSRDSCSIEVIPFPSRIVVDLRNAAAEGMVRVRIVRRNLDQAAGSPEQQALKEIEDQLRRLGLTRH